MDCSSDGYCLAIEPIRFEFPFRYGSGRGLSKEHGPAYGNWAANNAILVQFKTHCDRSCNQRLAFHSNDDVVATLREKPARDKFTYADISRSVFVQLAIECAEAAAIGIQTLL